MKIKIGIIGGSGFYQFLKGKEVSVLTPYGKPSDKILISEYANKKIAFLSHHGKKHQLKSEVKPGDFVIRDNKKYSQRENL